MKEKIPKVTVLMPVYNGEKYLREAIESILNQTWSDFEFLIINDGSIDDSQRLLERLNDGRIRVYNQSNQGLAATLNRAINLSRGKYLARQDQDDISLPNRIKTQVQFLENNPDCGMVGTWAEIWVENIKSERTHQHPTQNGILKFDLLFDNPFVHSSVMLRRSALDKVGIYSTDELRQPPEDYELWSRVMKYFEIANIPETLFIYREIPSSMSRFGPSPFLDKVINISIENLHWVTGRTAPDQNINDLAALTHGAYNRVSEKSRLRGISRVLFEVADKLSDSWNLKKSVLRDRAKQRLGSVIHHYFQYRKGRGLVGKWRCLVFPAVLAMDEIGRGVGGKILGFARALKRVASGRT